MNQRYTLTALTLFASIASQAQTGVLTSNEMLSYGSSYVQKVVQDPSAIDPTPGTNVTWNMTNLVPTGAALDVDILAPMSTQYGSNFPQSNYCIYEASIPRYSYFDLNATSFSRVGFYRTQLGTYSDPQTEMVYPLQMGSMNSDTWANNTVSFPGTYAYEVIGTGTLQLPGTTYNDVLLIRVVSTNLLDFISYQWVSAQNGAYLLIYNEETAFGDASGFMTTSMMVGLDETNGGIELRVHAPALGSLPVTYTANDALRYRVLDVSGRQLSEGSLPATTDTRTAMIDVNMLRSGIHLIELSNANGHSTSRFMIDQ